MQDYQSRIDAVLRGVVFAVISMTMMPAQAGATAVGPASEPSRSSSWWLKTGEVRQEQGDDEGAGVAYGHAMEALSNKKRRTDVGARIAMMAADAYWLAFESDGDLTHLRAGFEVLDRWVELAGPGSRASLLPRAERMAARFHAIYEPLQQAGAALAREDFEAAVTHYDAALEALAGQRRPWPVGAQAVTGWAQATVAAYDRQAVGLEELGAVERIGEQWQSRRPDDDASAAAPQLEAALGELRARQDAEAQRVAAAALAEQQRQAAEERRAAERAAQQQAQERARAEGEMKQRRRSVWLGATGGLALAAGAGLVVEGLVFSRQARQSVQDEQAQARALRERFGDGFASDEFDATVREFEDRVRTRTVALLTGGALLAAGGIATGMVGVVGWLRHRNGRSPGPTPQARIVPSGSRTSLHLSLHTRF